MAVELMMGFPGDGFPTKTEENAVEEAASAGIQSMERLLRLLSQSQQQQQQQFQTASDTTKAAAAHAQQTEMDYTAAADATVTKFRKVISLLGRSRTGHARFRRAPLPSPPQMENTQERFQAEEGEMEKQEFSKVYCPTPIQRLPPPPPPLPFSNHHPHHHSHLQHHQHGYPLLSIPKAGGIDAVKAFTSPPPSAANSFASSLTGDAETKHLGSGSSASAFQIVNLSQVSSSSGRPPLSSSSSLKRKCGGSKSEDGSGKCGAGSGRCHCSKRR